MTLPLNWMSVVINFNYLDFCTKLNKCLDNLSEATLSCIIKCGQSKLWMDEIDVITVNASELHLPCLFGPLWLVFESIIWQYPNVHFDMLKLMQFHHPEETMWKLLVIFTKQEISLVNQMYNVLYTNLRWCVEKCTIIY